MGRGSERGDRGRRLRGATKKAEHIIKFIKPKGRFHPFDVHTSSGWSFHVHSPEFIWMPRGAGIVVVYEPGEGVQMIDTDEVTECRREIKKKEPGRE
jgi:hypothetical protein